MSRLDNLIGQKFGTLTVLERDFSSKRTKWICKCDCGATTNVLACHLKDGHTTTCGDYKIYPRVKPEDLTGETFGFLTVVKQVRKPKDATIFWECKCKCGNFAVVSGCHLKSGHTKSCGKCKLTKGEHPWNFVDLTGKTFGYLTVKEFSRISSRGEAMWNCVCKCGKMKDVTSYSLTQGTIWQCGCKTRSSGEIAIASILTQNKIRYKEEYPIKTPFNNRPLRFDFAIFDDNNKPIRFIEFDGKQHFQPVNIFGGKEGFQNRKRNDDIKNQYCLNNKIPLVRIPYWAVRNICFENLFNDEYLIKEGENGN